MTSHEFIEAHDGLIDPQVALSDFSIANREQFFTGLQQTANNQERQQILTSFINHMFDSGGSAELSSFIYGLRRRGLPLPEILTMDFYEDHVKDLMQKNRLHDAWRLIAWLNTDWETEWVSGSYDKERLWKIQKEVLSIYAKFLIQQVADGGYDYNLQRELQYLTYFFKRKDKRDGEYVEREKRSQVAQDSLATLQRNLAQAYARDRAFGFAADTLAELGDQETLSWFKKRVMLQGLMRMIGSKVSGSIEIEWLDPSLLRQPITF